MKRLKLVIFNKARNDEENEWTEKKMNVKGKE